MFRCTHLMENIKASGFGLELGFRVRVWVSFTVRVRFRFRVFVSVRFRV